MRLGMVLPAEAGNVVGAARAAERCGFDSLWATDVINRGRMRSDPLVALGVAAAVTERVSLGTGILQAPLRSPILLANQVGTVATIAEGRLTLGVGSGSNPMDFSACGVRFEDRFTLLRENVDELRSLLRGEQVKGASLSAWPGLPEVPVMVGAWASGRWVEKAAIDYDGWIASAVSKDVSTIVEGLERFRKAGQGKPAVAANLLAWKPDAAKVLAELYSAGFDEVTLMLESYDDRSIARAHDLLAVCS